jgi:Lon protease-like protein
MLKTIASTLYPALYAARVAEMELERSTWTSMQPIFYYNQCLCPGAILSLHLFEPRYRIMMQRVVHTTKSFAYIPNFRNYRANVGDLALLATIEEAEFLGI